MREHRYPVQTALLELPDKALFDLIGKNIPATVKKQNRKQPATVMLKQNPLKILMPGLLAWFWVALVSNAWGTAQTWNPGSSGNWFTGANGWNGNTTWANGDTANFAGSDGTYAITVGGAISTAHGSSTTPAIKFSNSGYTLSASSAQSITMNNDGNNITYISVASSKTATIGNNVTLSKTSGNNGIAFVGGGTLVIGSGATITHPNNNTTEIENGTILQINGGSLGCGASLVVGQQISGDGVSGTLTVGSGTVTLGSSGSGGNLVIGANASDVSVANLNGGTVTCLGITKNGGSGTVNFNGGIVKAKSSATATFYAPTGPTASIKSGGVTFDNNGQALTISQALLTDTVSTGGGLTLNDSGANATLTLSGANTYTGPTTLTSGTLNAGVGQVSSPASGPLGVGGNINFAGGTLQFSSASASWDPSSRIAAGSSGSAVSIDPNGQSVSFGTGLTSSQSGGLTLNDTAVTKGKLTLSAANAYTGNTTITAGTLLVNNSTGSGTGSGSVSVSGTLGGSGIISGTVTVNSGGYIAPGVPGVNSGVGTLTVGGLTLPSGSILNCEITSSSSLDQIVVTGNGGLTLNGGAIYLYQPGTSSPFTANGTYNLIQYSGSIGGTGISALSVGNTQAGKTYTFGTSGGYVTLTIADSTASSYWNVDANGSWASAGNWTSSGVPNASGATANFGGGGTTITAPRTVTLDGTETVGGLNFNSAQSFTINQGTSGTLTLDNGASAAQIVESVGSHTIGAPVSVPSAGASVSVANSTTLALNGAVSGSGNIASTGPGTLTLGGSDSFNGAITISGGGTVQYTGSGANSGGGSYALSGASSTLTLNTAGTVTSSGLTIDRTSADVLNLTAGTLTVGASGIATSGSSGSSGTINFSGGTLKSSAGLSIAGNIPINLNTGGAVIDTTGGSIASSSSFLVGSGTGNLTVQGGNTLTLPSGNTYSGSTTIQNSSILALGASILPGVVTVSSGSKLDLANASSSIGGLAGAGTVVNTGGATSAKTLTITGTGGNDFSGAINPASANQAYTAVTVNLSSGTQTFSGANSYSGGTTISGGTLALSGSGTLGSGGLTMSGGTLDLGGLTSLSVGAVSISGAATIQNGSLTGTSYAASLTSGNATVTANLLGSGVGLTMSGTGGTLTLSGANTYTGGTTVSAGVLALNHNTSDSNPAITGNVNVNGAASNARGQLYLMNNSQLQSSATIAMNANNYYCDLILGGSSQTVASISTTGTSAGNNYCYIENSFNALGSGTGTLTINNSSPVTLGAYTYVRDTAGTGSGKLAIVLAGNSTVTAGAGAASTIINTGGWTLQSGTLQLAGSAFASTVPFTLQGGTLESDTAGTARSISGNLTFAGNVTLGDATLNGALTLGTAGTGTATISGSGVSRTLTVNSAVTINPAISDGGNANGITKSGSGKLTLSSGNTYTGNTTISAGTLLVNNTTGSGTGSGSVSVNSTATLGGSGTVSSAVTVNSGGTLWAGTGAGSLGTLTLGAAPTLNGQVWAEIYKGNTPSADQVKLSSGTLTYGGTLVVSNNPSSPALVTGDSFTLFNAASYRGWFSGVSVPALSAGLSWDTNDLATAGNLDVYSFSVDALTFAAAVGQPATIPAAKLASRLHSSKNTTSYPSTWSATAPATTSLGSAFIDGSGNLVYTATSAGSDVFNVKFYDGHGWQTMTVTATVAAANVGPTITPQKVDGYASFTASGMPNQNYEIQISTDMVNWTDYQSVSAAANGLISFTDSVPISNYTEVFFRLREL